MNYTKTLPYELDLTSRVLHEVMVLFFKNNKFPISLDEFIVLDSIYMNPEIIQIQIAKIILKGRGHTGKLLKSLEEKNIITRNPIMKNSKVVIEIKISDYGIKTYKAIDKKVTEFVKTISPEIESKIKEIIQLMKHIRNDAIDKFNIKFE